MILVDKIITDYQTSHDISIDKAYRQFLTHYHANALVNMIKVSSSQTDFDIRHHYNHLVHVMTTTISPVKDTFND